MALAPLGIIGGSGMLGGAIARAVLATGANLWISNRSGSRDGFDADARLTVTTDNQTLADACDVILLCVPPALTGQIAIEAPDKLILSVMAGVSRADLTALTGSPRVVRAMSSPAAAQGLAYSPWCPSDAVTRSDRALIRQVLDPCGLHDEIDREDQIDLFTAMTGPVPGFVAYFADAMVQYATTNGIPAPIADRAIRQLFKASGQMMATGPAPGEHVQGMIDYAGTTAAGLIALQGTGLTHDIATGLDAAVTKARAIGSDTSEAEG